MTLKSKSNQIFRTHLWPFSKTFDFSYSPLNSAKLNCSSEVTLKSRDSTIHWHQFGYDISLMVGPKSIKIFSKKSTLLKVIHCIFEWHVNKWPFVRHPPNLSDIFSIKYCKVMSRSTPQLVAHPRIFSLFMKRKFDANWTKESTIE